MSSSNIQSLIRDVNDFPKPGIVFKDITPLLADAAAFRQTIQQLGERVKVHAVEGLVAIEARGFIFGAALAYSLELPLVIVRKPGKLPYLTRKLSYDLEYGSSQLEVHTDAIQPGGRYAVIDDVLATGGTAAAAGALVQAFGATVACYGFLMELEFLHGAKRLGKTPVESLLRY